MQRAYQQTATFTRPSDTTAYASGDVVANSTTAASVTPLAFEVPLTGVALERVRITLSDATATNAKFKLHLYASSPTLSTSHGDNAAWLTTSSDYLGITAEVDCSTQTFADKVTGVAYVNTADMPQTVVPISGTKIYGVLTATAAYTPTSAEVITVTLMGQAL